MINENSPVLNALDNLLDKASKLTKTLDKISEEIKEIEIQLKEYKINLPFFFPFIHDHNEWAFSWEATPNDKRKRRVYLSCATNDFKKPYSECKTEIRLNFYKYLTLFLCAFTDHIQEETIMFESLAKDNKELWE